MKVKICGLRTPEAVAQGAAAGAAYLGFNLYAPSPRSVSTDQAKALSRAVPDGVVSVALVVDPEDAFLDSLLDGAQFGMLQLHGSETPERVTALRARFSLPVMKAVGIRDAADLEPIAAYEAVADQLLIDAKPPREGGLPGGNGLAFDWRLIAGRAWATPWLLAGGLTAETVPEAVRLTGAEQLDVSSGVESAPGVKDPARVSAFVRAAMAVEHAA